MAKCYKFFSLETCTKCPEVRELLRKSGMEGEEINATGGDGFREAAKYRIMSAPTVIFFDEKGREAGRAHTAEEVMKWT